MIACLLLGWVLLLLPPASIAFLPKSGLRSSLDRQQRGIFGPHSSSTVVSAATDKEDVWEGIGRGVGTSISTAAVCFTAWTAFYCVNTLRKGYDASKDQLVTEVKRLEKSLDARIEKIDARIEKIDARIEKIEHEVETIRTEMGTAVKVLSAVGSVGGAGFGLLLFNKETRRVLGQALQGESKPSQPQKRWWFFRG
jgi:hypothetical protein